MADDAMTESLYKFMRGFVILLFFFKQKTAYEMRISDWSSDVCSSDLAVAGVVNILLKPDYDGVSTMARIGASTDGGNVQQQYGLLGGRAWKSGGLLAAYDYSRSSSIRAGDRDYAGASNPATMLFPTIWRHSRIMSGHQALGHDITLDIGRASCRERVCQYA